MINAFVIFSALGGTTGSLITGAIFENVGGTQAFYLSLIPMTLLLFTLFLFRKSTAPSTEAP